MPDCTLFSLDGKILWLTESLIQGLIDPAPTDIGAIIEERITPALAVAGGTDMSDWQYAIPFAGSYAYAYDSYKNGLKKQADYYKNTGRKMKYSTDSYSARAYRTLGQSIESGIRAAKKGVRDVSKLGD